MEKQPILIISGTNRPGSNAMKIARIVEEQYRTVSIPAEILSLTDLPPEAFLPTVYLAKPPFVAQMQQRVLDAPGLHVITPEYNGSFPGVLKYFIDLLKFPESFDRKPVAFIGESAGAWGALRAVEHLQQVFSYRNAHLYPDRVFIPGVTQKLGGDDQLTDSQIQDRIAKQVAGFAHFITRF
jgi:NAD(P)H-dependent FMN reductase